jgi:hypothetical protein
LKNLIQIQDRVRQLVNAFPAVQRRCAGQHSSCGCQAASQPCPLVRFRSTDQGVFEYAPFPDPEETLPTWCCGEQVLAFLGLAAGGGAWGEWEGENDFIWGKAAAAHQASDLLSWQRNLQPLRPTTRSKSSSFTTR